jgi:hypothetical protein
MLFNRWYTSPTPSVEGAGSAPRSAANAVMFCLALVKAGSHRDACNLTTAWLAYIVDLR